MILDISSRSRAATRSGGRPALAFGLSLALALAMLTATSPHPFNTCLAQGKASSAGAGDSVAPEKLASLKALYDRRRYQAVVDAGQKLLAKMKKGEGDYARIKVLLTLASNKCQPILTTTGLAREAYESEPGGTGLSPVAASNYGILELLVGDHELAAQLLQKALQIAPDDFLSHVALAELFAMDPKHGVAAALSELAKAEAAGNTFGLLQGDKWLIIGDHYLLLREPGKALSAYLKAEKLTAADPYGQITQSVYRAALAAGQIDLAKQRLDGALAARTVSGDIYVLTAAKLCPPTAEGTALAKRLYAGAQVANSAESDLLYRMGRAFGNSGQDQYARLCFEDVLKTNPLDGKYVVAYAAQLAKSGNNVLARRQLSVLAKRFKLDEPTPQHALAQGLALAGLNLLKNYDSDWASAAKQTLGGTPRPAYKTAYAELANIKCHCRLLGMQYTLRNQPGVIFAYIPNDKTPMACLIYNSKVVRPGPIWDKINNEARVLPLTRQETLPDFAQLVQTALDYSEADYIPVKPYFAFNPLPLRQMQ